MIALLGTSPHMKCKHTSAQRFACECPWQHKQVTKGIYTMGSYWGEQEKWGLDTDNITGRSPKSVLSKRRQTHLFISVKPEKRPIYCSEMESGQWLPGNKGVGEGWLGSHTKKPVVVMATVCILLVEAISQVNTFVKIHQNVHLNSVFYVSK